MNYVHDLADIAVDDSGSAGGKGADLGELIAAGFPVPGGFVISGDGYWASMDVSGVRTEIATKPVEPVSLPAEHHITCDPAKYPMITGLNNDISRRRRIPAFGRGSERQPEGYKDRRCGASPRLAKRQF